MTATIKTTEDDIICPVCGYYCLGKGRLGCINKPWLISEIERRRKDKAKGYLLDLDSWKKDK